MSAVKLVAVFGENKQGQLAHLTMALSKALINVRWVTIATSDRFGVIKFLVDKFDEACQILRQNGFAVSTIEVLAVEVQDKPGGLSQVCELLADHNINVENSSGFVTSSHKRAVLIIETKDLDRARVVFKKQGMRLLSQEEILNL
jgi:hypothetical protein